MKPRSEILELEKMVGGGQALGTTKSGQKAFVWGGLPGETVTVEITKKKRLYLEGIVTEVHKASRERIEPADPASYLSTSPWQIMSFDAEQRYKAALVEEAFKLHNIVLPDPIEVFTDHKEYGYRNKVEFSWWGDTDHTGNETLDLAFFKRDSKGKIPVRGTSLARKEMNQLATAIRDLLLAKKIPARNLKTLLIRCSAKGECVWQLYVKDKIKPFGAKDAAQLPARAGEIIFSDPKSPASRITTRLASFNEAVLEDSLLGVPFRYAPESFFQVNLPVYEQALRDMAGWLQGRAVVDMYSGVGTIGLTIGGQDVTLVEADENAVREMKRNIKVLGSSAKAVHAPSEKALGYITGDKTIILDPPRAGVHARVIKRLLEVRPRRIIYLSCKPVTQARDTMLLSGNYGVRSHQGYNFFPRTPHIEHLVVLELISL